MPSSKQGEPAERKASAVLGATPRKLQKRALEKRATIVEAAIEEFSRYGYAGATIRQISDRAGVQNSLLRHYFPEKEDLWRACADALFEGFGEQVRKIRRTLTPGVPQLKAVIRLFLVEFVRRPEMARLVLVDSDMDLPRLTYVTEKHMEELRSWLDESIRIAQAQGAISKHDPLIFMTFILHAVSTLGARRSQIELSLNRSLNDDVLAEYEALIDEMVFGSGGR